MLVSGSDLAELREVEHDLIHRQRDDLARLERQSLRPLLRIQVRNLHVTHQYLLVGDAENYVAAGELVRLP